MTGIFYNMNMIAVTVEFQIWNSLVYLHYNCGATNGSLAAKNVDELLDNIEDIFGKGSYSLYSKKGYRNPEAVPYTQQKELGFVPPVTFFQNAVKTQIIERAYETARNVWPNVDISYMIDRCKSYVEDL